MILNLMVNAFLGPARHRPALLRPWIANSKPYLDRPCIGPANMWRSRSTSRPDKLPCRTCKLQTLLLEAWQALERGAGRQLQAQFHLLLPCRTLLLPWYVLTKHTFPPHLSSCTPSRSTRINSLYLPTTVARSGWLLKVHLWVNFHTTAAVSGTWKWTQ